MISDKHIIYPRDKVKYLPIDKDSWFIETNNTITFKFYNYVNNPKHIYNSEMKNGTFGFSNISNSIDHYFLKHKNVEYHEQLYCNNGIIVDKNKILFCILVDIHVHDYGIISLVEYVNCILKNNSERNINKSNVLFYINSEILSNPDYEYIKSFGKKIIKFLTENNYNYLYTSKSIWDVIIDDSEFISESELNEILVNN